MEREVSRTVVPALEKLQGQFDAWRRAGRKGRQIPEELWNAAAELAREIGVNPVVRALHLDYMRLKRRVTGEVASMSKVSSTTTGPSFVELAVDAVSPCADCVVEFEGRNGKVTMRLASQDPVVMVALAEALSRAKP